MTKRYQLTDKVKEKYTPIVQAFIDELEAIDPKASYDYLEKDFSDTEVNPYTLQMILESLGYKEDDRSDNGWQFDFVITMKKDGFKNIAIEGTGITFELKLSECD